MRYCRICCQWMGVSQFKGRGVVRQICVKHKTGAALPTPSVDNKRITERLEPLPPRKAVTREKVDQAIARMALGASLEHAAERVGLDPDELREAILRCG